MGVNVSKNIIKTAAILGVSVLLIGCSAGGKGKFVAACTDTMINEVGNAEEAKVACSCAYERLNEELSGKQLSMATKIISLKNQGEVQEYSQKNKGAELVSERIQGALKSCGGGF